MAEEKSTTRVLNPLAKRLALTRVASRSSASARGALSLRWYLVLLVAGALLPVVLFAIAVVYQLSNQQQAASERRILLAARNLAETVESEFSATNRALQALAASDRLEQNDLPNFHNEARQVVQTQATWMSVILLTPTGQQLLNTRQPFGRQLFPVVEPDSLQRVVETQQPMVGNLARGSRELRLAVPVRIPVLQDGKLQYILTAVIAQEAIAQIVREQTSIDGEWTRTVVDGKGIVVARTRNPERFVGQRGTPSFLKQISEATEGVYRDTTLEGRQVYVAFSRVGSSPWTVAVTVPVDVVQEPSRRAMWLVVGSGLILLLVSGVGAFLLSWQISRSITSAALAAKALANGEHPQVSPLSIKEVVLLGQSLEFAANLLSQREQERAENLMRVEAAKVEAEAANRIKDEFLAVLSHELRTPLNPILGWASLLRHGKVDVQKTAFALETIERNAKLQTQLIEDLLDVSRILKGKLSLNMAPVNLTFIVEAALETVRLSAEVKSIDLQFLRGHDALSAPQSDKPKFQVMGDAARLQQVVWNLLSNAIKFTSEGGQIEVCLERIDTGEGIEPGEWQTGAGENQLRTDTMNRVASDSPTYAQITVSDTGKGIDPDFLPHVFESFRQEDGRTTRRFGGLGLGLAIVRHLVELHGGTVDAQSPGEDQGATFTVRLPLLRDEVTLNQ
ncbi:sensor histidine kinase [Oscillatoria sp. FACHB-1407]|uniref:sensor histidine kinase n=1 Tax=Oscillatoria sp. FACHB-1407 TaxID=2692847 RepID=UPI00168480FE|nr:sensor histidine kinase [Oscillatoria sp. FACHB-1407]MBD2460027.1 sensor histidine kinase [Oscillatoria sp. FACHB-1407]